ncbi:MAG: hypothetical protein H7256_00455 [Bdellovibrio sp.]|nr:hypothetical protein [Bdellovibrio sp.]
MSLDNEIIKEFLDESKTLVNELVVLLEKIEGDFSKVGLLADYGNGVDRIMGGAKSLALLAPPDHALHMISDYAALCKAVGYKASQIKDNEQLFDICVGLLQDATDTLVELLQSIDLDVKTLKKSIPQAFLDRLTWASNQFSAQVSATVQTGVAAGTKTTNPEIAELIKKLGL